MVKAMVILALTAGPLMASGGSSEPAAKAVGPTPEEQAIGHYNKGLEHRDKAWEHEEKATEASKEKDRDKRLKKARKEYEKAIGEQRTATALNPQFHQAFSSLGYAYRKVGEYEQALKAYDRALVLDPNYTEAIEYRAEAYLGLGRLDEAKAAYEKLFLRDPERAAQLLVACAKWAAAPAEGVDGEALTAFKGWLAAKEETAREMRGVSGEGQQEW